MLQIDVVFVVVVVVAEFVQFSFKTIDSDWLECDTLDFDTR